MAPLAKLVDPCDCTLCEIDPVAVQVHVTVLPTATVSIAGFWLPLWELLNRMFPTMIWPAGPTPPPLPPPPPPPEGEVAPPHAVSDRAAATIHVVYRITTSTQGERDCATLAAAARWKYQTRRLRRARNSGTRVSDTGLQDWNRYEVIRVPPICNRVCTRASFECLTVEPGLHR